MANIGSEAQVFVNTIRTALDSVNPQVPFVDSSPSNQIEAVDPYTKRCALHLIIAVFLADLTSHLICCSASICCAVKCPHQSEERSKPQPYHPGIPSGLQREAPPRIV